MPRPECHPPLEGTAVVVVGTVGLVRQPLDRVVERPLRVADPRPTSEIPVDGLGRRTLRLLGQQADRGGRRYHLDNPVNDRLVVEVPRERSQQDGFADAVRADDSDPATGARWRSTSATIVREPR